MTLSETINVLIHSINELTTTLARIDEDLEHQAKAVERIAEKMDSLPQNLANVLEHNVSNDTATATYQQRESSPSPLLLLPDKDEESYKEGEINPSIVSPSSPKENFLPLYARESGEMDEEEFKRLVQSFDEFWEAYGYKRNKQKAWKAWKSKNMSWKSRKAAFEGIAAYKTDCETFGRPMCHAVTYLNQRRWEDDFNQGLEQSMDYIDGQRKQRNIITNADRRRRQREQTFAEYAAVAAEFRSQSGH